MDAFLAAYESQLTSITADERYEQREVLMKQQSVINSRVEAPVVQLTRRLESDVAFVRLPATGEWAGFRDVARVNGDPVAERGARLSDLLTRGADAFSQAMAMTAASSRYNLGKPRTINMPTVPLELLSPKYRRQFAYALKSAERVRGTQAVRVMFDEIKTPTVIRRSGGDGNVKTDGTIWVEPQTGAIRRIEVFMRDPLAAPRSAWSQGRMRVEFAIDPRLQTLVPVEMTEIFEVIGGRGEGKATYTNFKRFETGARLVPQ